MAASRLIFLGPPGTGKGTQAQRLAQRFGLAALSSGDVLRKEIRAGSEIGRQAAEFVQAGTLVPDDVITGVMLAAVDKLTPGTGFILDGFPRTVPQAEELGKGLVARQLEVQVVVDFQLDDQEIIKRIVSRRVCNKCGATYNTLFLPPRTADVCDKCGGELIQRVDDREDVIATRLETYRAQTAPLVDYYTQRGLLCSVDASAEAETVEADVVRIVEPLDAGG
ncbi:MAG: adenylate kinase [Planctomycetes bacterium]|nr:adenylate kinase [Planctomycetota bacterium]